MKYLSVCSGIEAATVAWHHMGWEPVAFSEIEPFPSAVLAHHYPSVPNWGDMTKFKEWPDADINVLVGGTPCQSFSIAGLRKGLDDPRGNLMLTYLAIADRYRPEWLVWENVPGVLSSNRGRDFGTLLGGLAELGYGFAYRILDAQYFGVAQKRRRVFVVANARDWHRAAAVLFERHSLQGHPAPSRETRERTAQNVATGTYNGGSWWDGGDVAATLTKQNANGAQRMPDKDNFGAVITSAITARFRGNAMGAPKVDAGLYIPVAQPVAFHHNAQASQLPTDARDTSISDSLTVSQQAAVALDMQVRRLMPVECERLQGFPDGYTNIPWRKKPDAPDGPRYKALGNSMAVPVMRWIGERIAAVEAITQ
jgi:DNA (cytosine-5)-methyltransferase 1